ncbi:MAG: hypothetical protein KDD01_10570 [Phaeodactylibacter sp.]|nr:hypothetical protein [Phaeodactylibacter sp.]MCB0611997.1 hypothetical protein [Phaeodactylibacter sp.]MCB9304596.1 hypothetical protein [Lewinellaceae bacterium]
MKQQQSDTQNFNEAVPTPYPHLERQNRLTRTRLIGTGIACGFQVHIDNQCAIHIGKGCGVTSKGYLACEEERAFRYYKRYEDPEGYFAAWAEAAGAPPPSLYELLDQIMPDTGPGTATPLTPQNLEALREGAFYNDKVVILYLENLRAGDYATPYIPRFLLIKQSSLAQLLQAGPGSDYLKKLVEREEHPSRSLFRMAQKSSDPADSKEYALLRKALELKDLVLRRFGYDPLVYEEEDKNYIPDDLEEPFAGMGEFALIWREYANIIDEAIPELTEALEKLYTYYLPLLTHREAGYFEKYIDILERKWSHYKNSGQYREYIQYFYDWMRDLYKAYEELKAEIYRLNAHCLPDESGFPKHLLLGKVKGGATTYTPSPFRHEFRQPPIYNGNADRLLRIRLLHWRMMMMIRTFDLPYLQSDEIAASFFEPRAEDYDFTEFFQEKEGFENGIGRYWRRVCDESEELVPWENQLPIKITPSRSFREPLGRQAIPFYYPLSVSLFSLYRSWDYYATRDEKTDHHLSYSAFDRDWSYSRLPHVLYPLAFDISPYPFLRIEGHIGRSYAYAHNKIAQWRANYNLDFGSRAVKLEDLPGEYQDTLKNMGMEHHSGVFQGGTFILVWKYLLPPSVKKELLKEIPALDTSPPNSDEFIIADILLRGVADPNLKAFKILMQHGRRVVADFSLPHRCCSEDPLPPWEPLTNSDEPAISVSRAAISRAAPVAKAGKKDPTKAKPAKSPAPRPKKAGKKDDLKQIKGIGPKYEKALNEMGITSYEQVSKLKKKDITAINERLKITTDRIERENWIGQAKKLAKV